MGTRPAKGIRPSDKDSSRAVGELQDSIGALEKIPFLNGKLFEGFSLDTEKIQRINHGLGRVPTGMMLINGNRGCFRFSIKSRTKKYIEFSTLSEWELLDSHDVTATETSFDFDADLDNQLDDDYRIEGYWKAAAQAGSYGLKLRINETDSPSLSNEGQSYAKSDATHGTGTGLAVAAVISTSTEEVTFWSDLRFRHGEQKMCQGMATSTWGTATSNNSVGMYAGKWEDTSTVIKTLGLAPTYSSSILAGSSFKLYRRPTTAKVTIWVY